MILTLHEKTEDTHKIAQSQLQHIKMWEKFCLFPSFHKDKKKHMTYKNKTTLIQGIVTFICYTNQHKVHNCNDEKWNAHKKGFKWLVRLCIQV